MPNSIKLVRSHVFWRIRQWTPGTDRTRPAKWSTVLVWKVPWSDADFSRKWWLARDFNWCSGKIWLICGNAPTGIELMRFIHIYIYNYTYIDLTYSSHNSFCWNSDQKLWSSLFLRTGCKSSFPIIAFDLFPDILPTACVCICFWNAYSEVKKKTGLQRMSWTCCWNG